MKIEIEHVSKKIKDALVLDDVCMTLESGNIYGFQGVNGSGKTMLMRAVSGLMYPTGLMERCLEKIWLFRKR